MTDDIGYYSIEKIWWDDIIFVFELGFQNLLKQDKISERKDK